MKWWTKSWNPVIGCTKCSPACDNCYAEALHTQRHKALLAGKRVAPCYAEPFDHVRFLPERLTQPLGWRKPQCVFVGNMGDLFHNDVPFWAIDRVYAAMSLCRQHTFMLLTKRPERMLEYMSRENFRKRIYDAGACNFPFPLPNVWLGTTIWDQPSADRAVPILLNTPAAQRFVSYEPALGPVDLEHIKWARIAVDPKDYERNGVPAPVEMWSTNNVLTSRPADKLNSAKIALDWVICGGETGPGARPMHSDWPRKVRDDCVAAGVPFMFKQWGEYGEREVPGTHSVYCHARRNFIGNEPIGHMWNPDGKFMVKCGKAKAGRVLDGRTWEEVPNA